MGIDVVPQPLGFVSPSPMVPNGKKLPAPRTELSAGVIFEGIVGRRGPRLDHPLHATLINAFLNPQHEKPRARAEARDGDGDGLSREALAFVEFSVPKSYYYS